MRVCNVCAKHPPDDKRVYDKISRSLIRFGHEVHCTSPNVENQITDDGIFIHGFTQKKGQAQRFLSLFRLYKVICAIDPEVILAHEPDALVVSYYYKQQTKKQKNLHVIFDCHEAYEHWFNEKTKLKFVNNILNKLTMWIINSIVKRIDCVTSVNQTMTNRFKTFNRNSFFLPSVACDDSIIETIPLDRVNKAVFFGGLLSSQQSDLFIETATRLRDMGSDISISIIGGFKEQSSMQIDFIEKIKVSKIAQHLYYAGWLQKEAAYLCLRNYSVGILRFDSALMPGNHAMPNKLFEYMGNGLAIIGCVTNNEVASIIKENNCGILTPDETAKSLTKALIWIDEHPNEVLEMGCNALRAVTEKYNWRKYGQLLDKIVRGSYNDILDELHTDNVNAT